MLAVVLAAAAAACGAPAAGRRRRQQARAAARRRDIVTLAPKPIAETSEFIATLRSLRSTTVQPEVEGIVTRIFVKAGDRVRAGDAARADQRRAQQAAVRSAEANRAGTAADVAYWRQQVKRLQSLLTAGAISRQEFDQAQNSLRTAEAKLAALDAQVSEGRVQLGYYRVTAPRRASSATFRSASATASRPRRSSPRSTTAPGLEAYIQVPLERSPELRSGLPVQLLDATARSSPTNPITFVAPRVDDATQTVLAKSALKELPPSRARPAVRAARASSGAPAPG